MICDSANEACLGVGQPQGAPLRMATDQEIVQHLWTGQLQVQALRQVSFMHLCFSVSLVRPYRIGLVWLPEPNLLQVQECALTHADLVLQGITWDSIT